jgi:hypothetical protein
MVFIEVVMIGSVGNAMIGAIVKAMTPPDIRQEIADKMAKELQEEIDWGILCDMFKNVGWTEIKLTWSDMTASRAHEIKEWCRSNLKGHYKGRGCTWLFELEKDATMFILKWQ